MGLEGDGLGRRHIQPPLSKGEKPAGYWFKQRGFDDHSLRREHSTTTGHMLAQSYDPQQQTNSIPPSIAQLSQPVPNRRRPFISNRISEHDNRNELQNYGEYFGRGYGRRIVPPGTAFNHEWMFNSDPAPVHPSHSRTQTDFLGWPSLTDPQSSSNFRFAKHNKSVDVDHWMKSTYDDFRRDQERIPTALLARSDYRRQTNYPWHY